MIHDNKFVNKELSWLAFNDRVLQEAKDTTVPIIERIRFLGIYSSNLDEFFRVRVAKIRRRVIVESAQENSSNHYSLLFNKVINKVTQSTETFKLITEAVFAELEKHHIHMMFNNENSQTFEQQLTSYQKRWLNDYFNHKIIRHITPIIIYSHSQLSSILNDDGIYFLVSLHQGENQQYALVEIPREEEKRFIVLPTKGSKKEKYIALLDDVVNYYINDIFKGFFDYDRIEAYSIKLTRDADYNLTDELDKSLLDNMSKGIKQRIKADPVRLVYDHNMPENMKKYLRKSLKIKDIDNLVPGVRTRHFKDFVKFPNLGRKNLENHKLNAITAQRFSAYNSTFEAISQHDILLYYPYYKYRHLTEFIRQASYDPAVTEIKINIYRIASKSQIISSLLEAVKNGKLVTVMVELKARFDEQANIEWAKLMRDGGISVEFGIESLKVHAKLCLISRKENEQIVNYAHIGTGNFNENTARTYTDFALFTKHKEICQEVDNIFSFISRSYLRFRFNHLIVSPLTARRRFYQLIDNEIEQAQLGKKAEITLKLNNLVDKGLINKLYAASNAKVKIRLIIRGMCSLIPGMKGLSENIYAISIIDRFLEHPRVMVFRNNGDNQVYISSADWMSRNIDHRVEVACPIYDKTLKRRILHTLELHFKDTRKARIINKNQDNPYVARGNRKKIRSQMAIHDYLVEQEAEDKTMILNQSK
ncbi:MAG: polyphosphate kinase 1 [Gammaproteobacteria bacterium]|nr:MAG: polyphosphate kinase 1 [Gammaproteobacteria bacterium]